MTINNDNSKPTDNMELLKHKTSACGPGCDCHAGLSGRARWIVAAIVLIAAGALMARAMIKNYKADTGKPVAGFALPVVAQAPIAGATPATNETSVVTNMVAVQEIASLSDLNIVAATTDGVFVFLAGKDDPIIKVPFAQIRNAVRTIEAQSRIKIGIFRLKTDSRDYEQVALQTPAPAVIAMVKGRGMNAIFGDITEAKLIQAFVAASSAGGGGCGPSGCGPGAAGCN